MGEENGEKHIGIFDLVRVFDNLNPFHLEFSYKPGAVGCASLGCPLNFKVERSRAFHASFVAKQTHRRGNCKIFNGPELEF